MTAVERRKKPRIAIRDTAKIVQKDEKTGKKVAGTGVAADVSEGGIRVQGREVLDPYREVEISFTLGDTIIEAKGRVRHLTFNRRGNVAMGIQFEGLAEKDKKLIERLCRDTDDRPPQRR